MAKKETNYAVYDYLATISESLAAQFKKETKLKMDKRPAGLSSLVELFNARGGGGGADSPDSGHMSGTPLAKSTPAASSKFLIFKI